MSNKVEQLEFKLEKNIGIQKHAGKMNKNWQVFSTSLHLSEETWAMIVCQK